MSKKLQLSIPTPCHENWDKMTKVEKGKFCGSCQKQVIDFSNMSDRQVADFFKKPFMGSVCGRFMQDQLDRPIEIPRKRIPWVKYFFQITIPLFLANLKSSAQGNVVVGKPKTEVCSKNIKGQISSIKSFPKNILGDTIPVPKENRLVEQNVQKCSVVLGGISIAPLIKTTTINGRVIDENGLGIAYATVVIKGTKTATMSDTTGNFKLNINREKNQITLVASYVGFMTVEKSVNLSSDSATNIIIQSTPISTTGLIVVGYTIRKKPKPELKNVPLLKQIKDTALRLFKVFPNPIKSNSSLNIETKQLEAGSYVLQLLNQSGQLAFTKELWIDDEARVLNLQLPSVAAGNYFLRMTNKKSGKSYTEKIIIQ